MTGLTRTRWSMIALGALVGVNALLGGWYGLAGAEGVDPAWLEGSPFSDYTIPSLFLLVVIGGGAFATVAAWWARLAVAPMLTAGLGAVLMTWILVQVAIIGYLGALQPVSFAAGVVLAVTGGAVLARRPATRVPGMG